MSRRITHILGREGGQWEELKDLLALCELYKFKRDPVHAVRFDDGSEWDCVNGWRRLERPSGAAGHHGRHRCPNCGCIGILDGDCEVDGTDTVRPIYRELWICAREDDFGGYDDSYGCKTKWWERYKYVGQEVQ